MPAISLENLSKFKTKLLEKIESTFVKKSEKGQASGIATLDQSGHVPAAQLPSYVDDIIEGLTISDFPETGEPGKIYVATTTSIAYRWAPGTGYVGISSSLQLGTSSSDAFYGDRGQTAYVHATDENKVTAASALGLYRFATTEHGHIGSITPVTAADIVSLGLPSQDTTYGTATSTVDGLMSATDKSKIDKLGNAPVYFAQCATEADVPAKVATCGELYNNAQNPPRLLLVRFANTNTAPANELTLAVTYGTESLSAAPIKRLLSNEYVSLDSSDFLKANQTYLFEYLSADNEPAWILKDASSSFGYATSTSGGFMSASDKERMDSLVFQKLYYGTCMTEIDVKDKKVLCPRLKTDDLTAGVVVFVYFQNGNSAAEDSLTMEVGSTGTKPLKCLLRGQLSKLPYPDYILGYQTYMFQYDGTNWVLMNTDTNDDASFAIDESTGELMVTIY